MLSCVEYIWLDGTQPSAQLRSKTSVMQAEADPTQDASVLPDWSFDGSSTGQASASSSDVLLKPVRALTDPLRGENSYIVLCETLDQNGCVHASNTRAALRLMLEETAHVWQPWVGFEQEYTLFTQAQPYGWPVGSHPGPQGPFYCGVGSGRAYGRAVAEKHLKLCLQADISIVGINAEVMPSQWEFQVGYRGINAQDQNLLAMCDHLWLSRWLLLRAGEEFGATVSFSAKPLEGDWNGAGTHVNFSTQAMRDPDTGWATLQAFTSSLAKVHQEHLACYGSDLHRRLTGKHETCHMDTFKVGECDRSASIRIPPKVVRNRCGYIEDRRPAADCDPYQVCLRLLQTYQTIA